MENFLKNDNLKKKKKQNFPESISFVSKVMKRRKKFFLFLFDLCSSYDNENCVKRTYTSSS